MVEMNVIIIPVVVAMVISGFIGFASASMLSANAYDKGNVDGYMSGYIKGFSDGHSGRDKEDGAGKQNEDTGQ